MISADGQEVLTDNKMYLKAYLVNQDSYTLKLCIK
jgi:hypothetical protein